MRTTPKETKRTDVTELGVEPLPLHVDWRGSWGDLGICSDAPWMPRGVPGMPNLEEARRKT